MSAITYVFHAPFATSVVAFNHINQIPLGGFYVLEIMGNRPPRLEMLGPFSESEAVEKCQAIVKELSDLEVSAVAPSELEF